MYSQEEINSAVTNGVISADIAEALRKHVAEQRNRPLVDEEHFRLVNSFNDIFVAIGAIIMLVAAAAIGQSIGGIFVAIPAEYDVADEAARQAYFAAQDLQHSWQMMVASLLVAATSWALAEFFTRKRRMALPSILLLGGFVGGVFACLIGLSFALIQSADGNAQIVAAIVAASGAAAAGAAWLHWRRFKVPITIAAGAASLAVSVIALIAAALEPVTGDATGFVILALVLVAGLAIFAFAMRWDISDRTRTTRRSDVAFWLHLLAAPMIAHPLFYALGVTDSLGPGIAGAIGIIAVYLAFGLVALAIDRRALLVSALAYVLIALAALFDKFGAVELTFALTALVIGSALLTLSAFWSTIRGAILERLPSALQARLPAAMSATSQVNRPQT